MTMSKLRSDWGPGDMVIERDATASSSRLELACSSTSVEYGGGSRVLQLGGDWEGDSGSD